MPILQRDDGVEFAVRAYRELLNKKKTALLKREIRLLESTNGSWLRLFIQNDGSVEGVFSHDPGCLLGETVWHYFDQPDDLLFCEELPGTDNAILVVVRQGRVFLDAEVPIDQLIDEFLSLITEESRYHIYVCGDVPLTEKESDDTFAFEPDFVASFNQLDEPVFPKLPADENLKLQELPDALKAFGGVKISPPVLLLGLVAVIVVIWMLYETFKAPPPAPQQIVAPTRPIAVPIIPQDPYQAYQKALETPSPAAQLLELGSYIVLLYRIPGWVPESFDYGKNTGDTTQTLNGEDVSKMIRVKMKSIGGDVELLQTWTSQNKIKMQILPDGYELYLKSRVPDRNKTERVYPSQELLGVLIDQLKLLLPEGKGITYSGAKKEQNYKSAQINIAVNKFAPQMLMLIADTIQGFPLVLNGYNIKTQDGLIDGRIELSLLGS